MKIIFEFIYNFKFIKSFAWENTLLKKIMAHRVNEINSTLKYLIGQISLSTFLFLLSKLVIYILR